MTDCYCCGFKPSFSYLQILLCMIHALVCKTRSNADSTSGRWELGLHRTRCCGRHTEVPSEW